MRRLELLKMIVADSPSDSQPRPSVNTAMTQWSVYDVHNRITHAADGQRFRTHRGLQELGGDLLSRAADWHPAVSAN